MTESELLVQVLLACSRGDARLFRSNAGLAWQGRIISQTPTSLVLAYPRPIKLMAEGFSDTCGFKSRLITPDMLGQTIAQWASLELKVGTRRPTAEQLAFLNTVHKAGGIAGVVRSVDEARQILGVVPA